MQKPLTILSSMATRQILAGLAHTYRSSHDTEVVVRAMGGVEAARLVRQGEPADLILLAEGPMASLESEGHVRPGSIRPFALSGIAVAVRAGTEHPDLHNAEAVRAAMLDARCIGYSTGPSGDYLKRLWETWGIAAMVESRSLKAQPGVPVARLVADGDADLGFQQLSELIGQPGIDIAGPLPPDIQQLTTFSVGISRATSDVFEAERLATFLTSDETAEIKIRHGMAVATPR